MIFAIFIPLLFALFVPLLSKLKERIHTGIFVLFIPLSIFFVFYTFYWERLCPH